MYKKKSRVQFVLQKTAIYGRHRYYKLCVLYFNDLKEEGPIICSKISFSKSKLISEFHFQSM